MAFDRDRLIATLESPEGEGYRAFPYDDATGKEVAKGDIITGNLTTAIGWNLFGRAVSRTRARIIAGWFVDDEAAQLESFPWFANLDDVRTRAILEMAFNMGNAKLMGFTQMIAALRVQAWNAAADAALDSLWAKQVPTRAARIAAMIRTGRDPADSKQGVSS